METTLQFKRTLFSAAALTIIMSIAFATPVHAHENGVSSAKQTGSIQVRTYLDSIGNPLGGVEVHVANTGFSTGDHDCSPYNRTTAITEGLNYGHAMFTNCPVANDGGPKKYHLTYVSRPGYHLSSNTPHPIGSNFTVRANQTTVVSVILSRNSHTAVPAATRPTVVPPPPPAPAPTPTPVAITPVAVAAPAPTPAALPQTGSAAIGLVGFTSIILAAWYYRRSRRNLLERQLAG